MLRVHAEELHVLTCLLATFYPASVHICLGTLRLPPCTSRTNLVYGKTAFATIDEGLAVAEKGDTLFVSDGR